MAKKRPAVYIMASKPNGTLYTGVTSDLARRVAQHKSGETGGFCRRYGVNTLVYCEFHDDMHAALLREKQVKKWYRDWKVQLIERNNPHWRDLSEDLR